MRRRLGEVATALLGALLLASCGGSDSIEGTATAEVFDPEIAAATTSTTTSSSTTTTDSNGDAEPGEGAAGGVASRPVDAVVWFHQFAIEVTEARVVSGDEATVEVDVTMNNISPSDGDLRFAEIRLEDGGAVLGDCSCLDLLPVPAGAKGSGTLLFEAPDRTGLDGLEVVFGPGDGNQSRVVLATDEAVTTRPTDIEPPAEPGSSGPYTLEVTAVARHAQDLWTGRPVDEGDALLLVTFDVSATRELGGRVNVQPGDFVLTRPDGTAVGPLSGAYPLVNEILSPGTTEPDLEAVFPVDLAGAGDYVLEYTPQSGAGPMAVMFTAAT